MPPSGPTRSRTRSTRTGTRRSSGSRIRRRTPITTRTSRSRPANLRPGAPRRAADRHPPDDARVHSRSAWLVDDLHAARRRPDARAPGRRHAPAPARGQRLRQRVRSRCASSSPEGPTGWRTTGRRQRPRLRASGSIQPPLLLGHTHRQPGDAERRCGDVCVEARLGAARGAGVEGHGRSRRLAGALGQRLPRLREGRARGRQAHRRTSAPTMCGASRIAGGSSSPPDTTTARGPAPGCSSPREGIGWPRF